MNNYEIFGRLTAIKEINIDKPGRWMLLQCECGEFLSRALRDLRAVIKRGNAPGCRACSFATITANGKRNNKGRCSTSHRKLYDVHRQMFRRCSDPASADWAAYGGRGIHVCKQWIEPAAFIAWALSTGYHERMTIERINVNGNYEPSNCTWIENKRQARNTRKVLRVAVNGDHQLLVDLANSAGIPATTIKGRLRRGWSVNEALTIQPVKGRNQSWRGCL